MTLRFAFYGRVSTEDQQDPETSRNWQRTRAQALVEAHGHIVAEYFDIGHSRSLPWKRRSEASRLLAALKDPGRGFDAVVIGEPQRAFYGNQYSLTFPVFDHYGVGLWVPEVGGAIDATSEAHDLIMSVFGGMSKGERNRIKIRVRSAMGSQAQLEGRYLGGRPPYGYRLADAGPHPNPGKAADGKRLHTLELDATTTSVVKRIYHEYLDGYGIFAIAQGLTADGIPCPSAHDPARNTHRCGLAWSKSAVRTILTNPRYTGYQVWNKQHKHESLIDVDDVALGHETRLRWNERHQWVWSDQPTHPALIDRDVFTRVEQRLASRGPTSPRRAGGGVHHPYVLRSLITCRACGRRMQGTYNHGRPHYRCRFPTEYALANNIDHPKSVYVREDQILEPLDQWLATAFHPDHIEHNLHTLAESQNEQPVPHIDQARRVIADCDRKLTQHKAALEAGADPATVAGWMNNVQAERTAAQARLASTHTSPQAGTRLTPEQIHQLVNTLGDLLTTLQQADPQDKAQVYRQLGLTLTYDHTNKTVLAEANTVDLVTVSEGGLEPPRPGGH